MSNQRPKRHQYQIGMDIDGVITGIQPYGIFVALDENTQGLIHISEVKNGYIKNVSDYLEVGTPIRVKIIDIDEYSQKISLSLRVYESLPHMFTKKQRKHYFTNKHKKIGFISLHQAMPGWIQEALDRLEAS